MKISDYMPNLYKNNTEMNNIINVEENELENNLKANIENSFKDNFVKTATLNGIREYEKLLSIPIDNDNLEYRKSIIINKLSTTVPLTYNWLDDNLYNLVGKNNYKIELDYDKYIITINIRDAFINIAETLQNIYRPLFPANLVIIVNLFDTYKANLYVGSTISIGDKIFIEGGT
jgi:hypothetical protein